PHSVRMATRAPSPSIAMTTRAHALPTMTAVTGKPAVIPTVAATPAVKRIINPMDTFDDKF
ncbi:hypothetical protein BaRGS_00036365, partial [Batillaria attramentaria]